MMFWEDRPINLKGNKMNLELQVCSFYVFTGATLMTDTEAMIADCINRYKKLTEWEQSFIDVLYKKKNKNNLTDLQLERLEKIWERIT